jgi:hypothetical protein
MTDPGKVRSWEVLDPNRPLLATLYGSMRARTVVVGLGDQGLLVISPGRMEEARFAALASYGAPRFLLAPNYFHNLGIASWVERFPEATVVAHERAIPRLKRQVPGVNFAPLEVLQPSLPAGVRTMCPPGARQGETWVSVATPGGVAWFVTDAILNEAKLPTGATGAVMWTLGFRTGMMVNPVFKRFFLSSRPQFKDWALAELERDRPTWFLPAHGDPLRGNDVADRLRAIIDAA